MRLLTRALPRLIHGRWGVKATINKNEGNKLQWRKFGALSATTTALTEGQTPAAGSASVTKVTATPSWYGYYLRHSDVLELTSIDPILQNFSAILGEQCGLSIDTLTRDVLVANGSVQYSGTATARTGLDTTNDKISYTDVVKALGTLMANDALPVEGARYVAILHPDTCLTRCAA